MIMFCRWTRFDYLLWIFSWREEVFVALAGDWLGKEIDDRSGGIGLAIVHILHHVKVFLHVFRYHDRVKILEPINLMTILA